MVGSTDNPDNTIYITSPHAPPLKYLISSFFQKYGIAGGIDHQILFHAKPWRRILENITNFASALLPRHSGNLDGNHLMICSRVVQSTFEPIGLHTYLLYVTTSSLCVSSTKSGKASTRRFSKTSNLPSPSTFTICALPNSRQDSWAPAWINSYNLFLSITIHKYVQVDAIYKMKREKSVA